MGCELTTPEVRKFCQRECRLVKYIMCNYAAKSDLGVMAQNCETGALKEAVQKGTLTQVKAAEPVEQVALQQPKQQGASLEGLTEKEWQDTVFGNR